MLIKREFFPAGKFGLIQDLESFRYSLELEINLKVFGLEDNLEE